MALRVPIAWKIGLLAILPVVVAASVVGWSVYQESIAVLEEHERVDLADEARLTASQIKTQIATLREDVLKLSVADPVQAIVRAREGKPLPDDKPEIDLRQELAELFRHTCHDELGNTKPYFQVRLIGEQDGGREIVRIQWSDEGNDVYETTDFDELDSEPNYRKEDRPYFQRTRELALGDYGHTDQVYVSQIELNVEGGVKQPDRPVLRAAVPVYNRENDFFGIVIINSDMNQIASEITSSPRHLLYLTNSKGDFIIHPNKEKAFVWDKTNDSRRVRIQDEPNFAELAGEKLFEPSYKDATVPTASGMLHRRLELRGFRFPLNPNDTFTLAYVSLPPDDTVRQKVGDEIVRIKQDFFGVRAPSKESLLRPDSAKFAISAADRNQMGLIESRLKEVGGESVQVLSPYPVDCQQFYGHFYRVYFDPCNPDRYLGLVRAFSKEELDAELGATRWVIFWSITGGTLLVGVVALVFSQLLSRRLGRVTKAAKEFADGNYDVSLASGGRDEIGDLTRGFQHMITQVRLHGAEIREREARLRMIFNSAAEGILTVDEQFQITSANLSVERMFRFSSDALMGRTIHDLLDPRNHDLLDDSLSALAAEDSSKPFATHAMTGRRRDGSTFPLELSATSVLLDEQPIFSLIVRDITERKNAEEKIRHLNESLEQRVRDRTSELIATNEQLAAARDRAESSNRTKSTFLANMSHELRTPLNTVIGYSEMLQEDAEDAGDAESVRQLQKIHRAGRHLLTLIDDVLDLAKVEAGKIKLEPEQFRVGSLVEEVIGSMEFAAQKNSNRLETRVDGMGTMYADRTRLRQLLYNLLSNACKFTSGGTITLTVENQSNDGDDDQIVFTVSDSGIGMSPEQLSRLFQPFEQADSSISREYGGTGLGLAISKRFCALMGGEIDVSSEPDKGTTFVIQLPRRQHEPDEEPGQHPQVAAVRSAFPSIPAPTDRERPLILVVDDDPNVCELMEKSLSRSGFDICTAGNGDDAVRMAKELRPDAVTLDAVLPGMDGWSVLSALKADEATNSIPVIMVTMDDQKSRGLEMGATYYMTKPVNWSLLTETLRDNINGHRGGKPRILLIEDDEDLRELTRKMLEKEQWLIDECGTAEEALEHLKETTPALILLDLMLPGMSGLDFIQELRNEERGQQIPIVVMTSLRPLTDLSEEERECIQSNAAEVILKGSSQREEFLNEIRRQVAASVGGQETATERATMLLLVEDEIANQEMLAARLRRRGYDVIVADDGQQAIDRTRSEMPNLVLMDIRLPVLDGYEATRQLKADPATRDIPIIALTAHAMVGDREKAIQAGCDDHDTKPVEMERLCEKIEHALNDGKQVESPEREV